VQLNPAVPKGLESMISKALEKDREKRYQSARELAEDLKAAVDVIANHLSAARLVMYKTNHEPACLPPRAHLVFHSLLRECADVAAGG
jgi:hypothetical protein